MKSEQSEYTGFEFEWEGFPATAIINAALKEADRSQYPYSVFILLRPDLYTDDGQPTPEEFDYLNEVEKELIAYLEEQTQTVHVGHITIYRGREIIFYTKDEELVSGYLNYILPEKGREHELEIKEDREWQNVSPFYEQL